MSIFKPSADDLEAAARAAEGEYDKLREPLHMLIADFADKHDLSHAMLSLLLVDLGVTSRMMDYMLSVEKPSGSGLKLELDRFGREIDDFVRSSKKAADDFVSIAKEALAQAVAAEAAEAAKKPE